MVQGNEGAMGANLDDMVAMENADPSGTREQMAAFLDHLESGCHAEVTPGREVMDAYMCGIGGSAMGADIMNDLMGAFGLKPMVVVRDIVLPRTAGRKSLAIITSYSGNTQEALDCFEDAISKGCEVVVIASGGRLPELAREQGASALIVPKGVQPRAALGHLLGHQAAALQAYGFGPVAKALCCAGKASRPALEKFAPTSPASRNPAKKTAEALQGKIPVIYAPHNMRSAAVRWQNQINENAKMVAFAGEVPEMNHNQMVGWLSGMAPENVRPVFLLPSGLAPTVEKMTKVTVQMFNEHDLSPIVIPLHGASMEENLLSALMMGDAVSLYLAILNGVDPEPVEVIKEFKKRIA
jgi:glucose/mannose-6-phosphate isomerase